MDSEYANEHYQPPVEHTTKLWWQNSNGFTPCSPAYLQATDRLANISYEAEQYTKENDLDDNTGDKRYWQLQTDIEAAEQLVQDLADAGHRGAPVDCAKELDAKPTVVERFQKTIDCYVMSDGSAHIAGPVIAGGVKLIGNGTIPHPFDVVLTPPQKAAPDLLEALQALLPSAIGDRDAFYDREFCSRCDKVCDEDRVRTLAGMDADIDKAQAAIARATGIKA